MFISTKQYCFFVSLLITVFLLTSCGPKRSIMIFSQLEPLSFSSLEKDMIETINTYRKKNRLPTLRPDPLLSRIARSWSEEMARAEFCAHVHPEDSSMTPQERLTLYNRARLNRGKSIIRVTNLYENVGFYSRSGKFSEKKMADIVWKGFLKSRKHKKNILQKKTESVGIGIVVGSYKGVKAVYVTQLFSVSSKNSSVFIGADAL